MSTWRAAALRAVNRALGPLGLVVRTLDEESDKHAILDALTTGISEALRWAARSEREAARMRRHLRELDALVTGHSAETRAARRVLDVALGRDTERAA